MKKELVKRSDAGPAAAPGKDFGSKHADSMTHAASAKMALGRDFRILQINESNVPKRKRDAKKSEYVEGERLFQGLMKLLKKNFPASEIESEKQYREYFHDENKDSWFVQLAVDNDGNVMAAGLYSIKPDARIVMFNIIVTDEGDRLKEVASQMLAEMLKNPAKYTNGRSLADFDYVMAEIEQPDPSLRGRMAKLVNEIRPAFHDKTSKVRAIRLPNGEPLIYLLPIMASDDEREAAKAKGDPFEPEPLLLSIRPLLKNEKEGISSREVARLLIWFYKDYLERECADVKTKEVNNLLAEALSHFASVPAKEIEAIFKNKKMSPYAAVELIPEEQLSFMLIKDTEKKVV